MMAYAWTNTDADCTIVGSQPPANGVTFVEVQDGTDPGAIFIAADGTAKPVPPSPGPRLHFSPAAGAWIDPRSEKECWDELRRERDARLRSCDWTQASDAPLSAEQLDAWRTYRQTLRDLPAATQNPRNPDWPLPPAV
ncbi:phage tail assembly chaperone [Paracoccus sp. MA]|uniref:tail fiber assembly protein n=1 Tax=Paracoccus sp. MA TaxID=2895796 RepID=UPI001E435ED0|nr:tail fiber assembly protein [Paracoccus sp. MA]UFM64245.1 phage tail assembly chaperone [Paracoccus sp. MA]